MSVNPRRRAASSARVEGADTAQKTGIPATAAFCTSSKLARPDTTAMLPDAGTRPSRSSCPTSLSIALWRPTSSRETIASRPPRKAPQRGARRSDRTPAGSPGVDRRVPRSLPGRRPSPPRRADSEPRPGRSTPCHRHRNSRSRRSSAVACRGRTSTVSVHRDDVVVLLLSGLEPAIADPRGEGSPSRERSGTTTSSRLHLRRSVSTPARYSGTSTPPGVAVSVVRRRSTTSKVAVRPIRGGDGRLPGMMEPLRQSSFGTPSRCSIGPRAPRCPGVRDGNRRTLSSPRGRTSKETARWTSSSGTSSSKGGGRRPATWQSGECPGEQASSRAESRSRRDPSFLCMSAPSTLAIAARRLGLDAHRLPPGRIASRFMPIREQEDRPDLTASTVCGAPDRRTCSNVPTSHDHGSTVLVRFAVVVHRQGIDVDELGVLGNIQPRVRARGGPCVYMSLPKTVSATRGSTADVADAKTVCVPPRSTTRPRSRSSPASMPAFLTGPTTAVRTGWNYGEGRCSGHGSIGVLCGRRRRRQGR